MPTPALMRHPSQEGITRIRRFASFAKLALELISNNLT